MADSDKILIGLTTTREADFGDWYRQTIVKSQMIDYSDISGCYILRPNSYNIWEQIQKYVQKNLTKMGVQNGYFPVFISKQALEKEKSHIEGFSPEVAWVTKSGQSDLAEPIAVRPTSETSMYPSFAKWINSHRDLPLKINQWCNVVRWEMKDCTPFLRSREFLWSETHTCHQEKENADDEITDAITLYANVYQNLLCVPVIAGRKSEREKFAGADYTSTVECYIPVVGKAVQGATAHCLGQNFSKMFNIVIEDSNRNKQYVYQNSWGITTRTIGVMTMVHGDNRGLVLPPSVAPVQIIIIPCGINSKTTEKEIKLINNICHNFASFFNEDNIRTRVDDRDNYRVGYKFNYWEMRGVPLRIEFGPKDILNETVTVVRRDTGEKTIMPCHSVTSESMLSLLETIQNDMYNRALTERNKNISVCSDINNFVFDINNKNMCLVPWCEQNECEESVIAFCKLQGLTVKSLCIPFNQNLAVELTSDNNNVITPETKCFHCDAKSKSYTLFGASY